MASDLLRSLRFCKSQSSEVIWLFTGSWVGNYIMVPQVISVPIVVDPVITPSTITLDFCTFTLVPASATLFWAAFVNSCVESVSSTWISNYQV